MKKKTVGIVLAVIMCALMVLFMILPLLSK
jgi:hypothetical protein